jgi:hypothetical protein
VDFLFQQYLAIDDGHLNAYRSLNEPFLITRQILHHHRISCNPKDENGLNLSRQYLGFLIE